MDIMYAVDGSADASLQANDFMLLQLRNNQVIDLSPLIGNPKWLDEAAKKGTDQFSYNPCKPFTEKACKNVAVCQIHGTDLYGCGTQDSATFNGDKKSGLSIQYKQTGADKTIRKSNVKLNCIKSGDDTLEVDGEKGEGTATYDFVLNSVHCCVKTTPSPSPGSKGLSIGSIMSIVFFSLVILYFVLGIVIQKFARHKSGKEVIPNVPFWTALPGLIKDGVLFVVRRGKTGSSYNSI